MLVSPSMSPALGVFVTSPNHMMHRNGSAHHPRDRRGSKSAPPQVWHKRSQLLNSRKNQQVQNAPTTMSSRNLRNCSTAGPRRVGTRHSAGSTNENRDNIQLRVDDVVWLAEQAREVTSLENRRSVMEEAQKTIRQETTIPDSSRPHSVIGVGLQAMTSPMPFSAKNRHKPGQVDHIPTLLSLPSDRTFIPSPDTDHARHTTTPAEEINLEPDERSQSVAKQCCEIMGPSLCRTCRKLESRLLNREQAEKECPRMRITQENITTTQLVKRLYPRLTNSEIQDKIARGEIARTGFPPKCRHHRRRSASNSSDDDSDDSERPSSSSEEISAKKENKKPKLKFSCQHVSTLMVELARLKAKLKNQTSTPLFFTDLKRIQAKIISGEVDRKKYLTKEPKEMPRLKSAMSSISTTSSTKTTLSKLGVRLSESLMPVFVSPRKVKTHEEPSYKAFYEPPLLSKRRQIPNPSFFAGSSEAYSLPERLPDIIEFADSKIKLLERQGRSMSSMSMMSNLSEEFDNVMSGREGGESGRSGQNTPGMSSSQRDLKIQLVIQEQSEQDSCSNHNEAFSDVKHSVNEGEGRTVGGGNDIIAKTTNQHDHEYEADSLNNVADGSLGSSRLDNEEGSRQLSDHGDDKIRLDQTLNGGVDGGCHNVDVENECVGAVRDGDDGGDGSTLFTDPRDNALNQNLALGLTYHETGQCTNGSVYAANAGLKNNVDHHFINDTDGNDGDTARLTVVGENNDGVIIDDEVDGSGIGGCSGDGSGDGGVGCGGDLLTITPNGSITGVQVAEGVDDNISRIEEIEGIQDGVEQDGDLSSFVDHDNCFEGKMGQGENAYHGGVQSRQSAYSDDDVDEEEEEEEEKEEEEKKEEEEEEEKEEEEKEEEEKEEEEKEEEEDETGEERVKHKTGESVYSDD